MTSSSLGRILWPWVLRLLLLLLALALGAASAVYWWTLHQRLTGQLPVVLTQTLLLVAAPPILTSFLLPWTPGGQLLRRIEPPWLPLGVVTAALLLLVAYSIQVQLVWWTTQPEVLRGGLVLQQATVGVIGFLLIPALLWMPLTSADVADQVRQARLTRRAELQTQAELAMLRAGLLRAQEKALIGFANLTAAERDDLADALVGLVASIDETLHDLADGVSAVSDQHLPFDGLEDNQMVRDYLTYVADGLRRNALTSADTTRRRQADRPAEARRMTPGGS